MARHALHCTALHWRSIPGSGVKGAPTVVCQALVFVSQMGGVFDSIPTYSSASRSRFLFLSLWGWVGCPSLLLPLPFLSNTNRYDGMRAQIHLLPDGSLKFFSRNSKDSTPELPDLIPVMKVFGCGTAVRCGRVAREWP